MFALSSNKGSLWQIGWCFLFIGFKELAKVAQLIILFPSSNNDTVTTKDSGGNRIIYHKNLLLKSNNLS